ncbi:MAG: RtcB family protein [Actinomycetia bacterium]|nr:RtcB family protein [Actinomycetes bacterium]
MELSNGTPGGSLLEIPRGYGGVGVRSWASILDHKTRDQALVTSLSPVLAGPVALMADAHLGRGATVGSVIITHRAIIPAAVGVDIGCGMIAALTNRRIADLEHPQGVLNEIRRGVPAGFNWHQTVSRDASRWLEENPIPHARQLPRGKNSPARVGKQMGTLGGGNHFVEISSDELDRLWIVLHTGSRGIGNRIATYHMAAAAQVCTRKDRRASRDLAYYLAGDSLFNVYIDQMLWAQSYAWRNRELILDVVWKALRRHMGNVELVDMINCHHNYAAEERHDGRTLWVTRKGAIRAGRGDRGVIPGSMGTDSYIVQGLGNPLSYCSAAHGAGRVHSRNQARKRFTAEQLTEVMKDKVWEQHKARRLVDESPWSYKPIEQVMKDQEDLVVSEHRLVARINYKGA